MLTPSELESLLGASTATPVWPYGKPAAGQSSHNTGERLPATLCLDREQSFAVESMHRQMAHGLGKHLSQLVNHTIRVELTSIEVDAGDLIPIDRSLTACWVVARVPTLDHPVLLEFGQDVVRPLLDRMLGGTGDVLDEVSDRNLSEIDQRLLARTAESIVAAFVATWPALHEMSGEVTQVECAAIRVREVVSNAPFVRSNFELESGLRRGRISLCIRLDDMLQLLDHLAAFGRCIDAGGTDVETRGNCHLAGASAGDNVECVLMLTETWLTANAIRELSVGDVILTDRPVTDGMQLRTGAGGERPAVLGQSRGRKVARIVGEIVAETLATPPEGPASS